MLQWLVACVSVVSGRGVVLVVVSRGSGRRAGRQVTEECSAASGCSGVGEINSLPEQLMESGEQQSEGSRWDHAVSVGKEKQHGGMVI